MKRSLWAVVAVALAVGTALAPAAAGAQQPPDQGGSPDSEIGVTADTIRIAVIADVDNPVQPGLFQGTVKGVQAFGKYMNSHGKLAGRNVQVDFIDSHLSADVKKLRYDPAHQMTMLKKVAQSRAGVNGLALMSHIGQTREVDHRRHSQKDCGDYKIRHSHRIRLGDGCLPGRISRVRQNKRRPDDWGNHRTHRIERL